MKNILIFGKTQASAHRFLHKFAEKRNDIQLLTRTKLELLNGDVYRAVGVDYSSCGMRFNKAYVQEGVSREIMDNIIYPCFVSDYDIIYFKGD